jgi:hypothetical protein
MCIVSKLWMAAAGLAALAFAGSASAVTTTYTDATGGADPGPAAGQTVAVTFDGPNASFVNEDTSALVTGGIFNGTSGIAAAPLGDTSDYEAIQQGAVTFSFTKPIDSLSVYLGSIDQYNTITITEKSGTTTYAGTGFTSAFGVTDFGSQTDPNANLRAYFTFTPGDFESITFSSSQTAFEFDNIAVGGVPEPAAWALMLVGFGGLGAALRFRRSTAAIAA